MSIFNLNVDFSEIQIFEDTLGVTEIIKQIIQTKKLEEAFYVADIGDIIKRYEEWINEMPRVIPYYAVAYNTNSTVIKVLAVLNGYFSCMSKEEIAQVMQHNVPGERIIFAHPSKWPSHITYAKEKGVELMTVDSEEEIEKIKNVFPEAKIVLRICYETENSPNMKFGCNSEETLDLMQYMKNIGLNLYGFSFRVKSYLMEDYGKGIRKCKQLISIAQEYGHNVQMINIGGVFPKERQKFYDLAIFINEEIKDLDPRIRIISEAERYFVESNFILVSRVKSKKLIISNNTSLMHYYMDCGVHNSFLAKKLAGQVQAPRIIHMTSSQKKKCKSLTNIWGPTIDSFDLILQNVIMPNLEVGYWLKWKNMGFETLVFSNTFNGFPIPTVKPFIRKNIWENFVTKYLRSNTK